MSLLIPKIVQPIFECSEELLVQGQLTGAVVIVRGSKGGDVAAGIATWSSQRFPVLGALTAKEQLTVTQAFGDEKSLPTSAPVEVLPKPSVVSGAYIKPLGPIFDCATCAWLTGAYPGAVVTIGSTIPGTTHGSTHALGPGLHVNLSPRVGATETLVFSQTVCGKAGPETSGPPSVKVALSAGAQRLPAPAIPGPLRACDRGVLVIGVLPGTQVVLERSKAGTVDALFSRTAMLLTGLDPPLQKDEQVRVRQVFPGCLEGDWSAHVTVGSAEPVPPPVILGPICAGSPSPLLVSGLRLGALVTLLVDGVDVGSAEAYDVTCEINAPMSFPAGAAVAAFQTVCGSFRSDPSSPVTVQGSLKADKPKFLQPLVDCATAVEVGSVTPGAVLSLRNAEGAARSDPHIELSSVAVLHPSPPLFKGEEVSVRAEACGKAANSARVTVAELPLHINAPYVVSPLIEHAPAVGVRDVVPGATVDLLVDGAWTTSAESASATMAFPIPGGLKVPVAYAARQRICGSISPVGPAQVVRVPGPHIQTKELPKGRVGTLYTTTLAATGGLGPYKWLKLPSTGGKLPPGLELSTAGVLSGKPTTASSWAPFDVTVQDNGLPVLGDTRTFNVQVEPALPPPSPPPPPVKPTMTGISEVWITNCSNPDATYSVWLRDASIGGGWVSHGSIGPQWIGWTCPVPESLWIKIPLTDSHIYELVVVDQTLPGCSEDDPAIEGCRKYYSAIQGSKSGSYFYSVIP